MPTKFGDMLPSICPKQAIVAAEAFILARTSDVDNYSVKQVIFNNPATIIYWADGSKTVVKCQHGDTFDREKGLMAAFMKKALGNKNEFNKVIRKWVAE